MRRVLINLLKMTLVLLLFLWLSKSGRLDFRELAVLVRDPRVFFANLCLWGIAYVLFGTVRWYLLVRGLGLDVSFPRALQLQLIGFFFNTAMPGAVGGDIVKAVYIIREQAEARRARAMLTVLLDRLIGLAGLFFIAGVAMLADGELLSKTPALKPVSVFIGLGILGIFGVFLWLTVPLVQKIDPIPVLLRLKIPGIKLFSRVYDALLAYRQCPSVLVWAFLISICIQSAALSYGFFLTKNLIPGASPGVLDFAVIFPLGVMSTALPLAPGGLGVGHVAFDRLYQLIGLTGGANVFNVMVLGQLALNLLGFIPYLLFKTKLPAMSEILREAES
jgi:hypothetical protein